MAGRRAPNTNAIDEDDDNEVCRKMKSLNQLEDAVVDTHKHHEEEEEEDDEEEEEEGEEVEGEVARPIGDVIRVSNEGGNVKKHFKSFEFDGVRFHLEDPVLVTPEEEKAKPSVAIIKTKDGELMISGQRFYRPEEAEKEKGGTWQRHDPRELFYSWHRDDLPADSVMHRCIIHLVPLPKPLPNRKLRPGFVVRKVYDYEHRRLGDLTDRECKGSLIKRGMVESV